MSEQDVVVKGQDIVEEVREAVKVRRAVERVEATENEIVIKLTTSAAAISLNRTLAGLGGKRKGTKLYFDVSKWTAKELREFLTRLHEKQTPKSPLMEAVNELKEQLSLLPTALEKLNELADLKQQLEGLLEAFGELKKQLSQQSEQLNSLSKSLDLLTTRFDALSIIVQNLEKKLLPPKEEWGPREGESQRERMMRLQRELEEAKNPKSPQITEYNPPERLT